MLTRFLDFMGEIPFSSIAGSGHVGLQNSTACSLFYVLSPSISISESVRVGALGLTLASVGALGLTS